MNFKDILEAPDEGLVKDFMITDIISLHPDSTLKEAAGLFDRYDFRAIPIVDDSDRIVGVIPYRDVMKLTHHFVG